MSNILFCDTNILRHVLDDQSRFAPFVSFVDHKNYTLAISLIQLVEMVKLPRYHTPLARLIFETDAHLFLWWKLVVESEAKDYPTQSSVDPLIEPSLRSAYPGPQGASDLALALAAKDLNTIWAEFENQKVRYTPVMEWLPSTVPRNPTKEAIDSGFRLHNYGVVLQVLREVAPQVVEHAKDDPEAFDPSAFPGVYVHAGYVYYRYILKGMSPQPSDTPDLHQVFYVPYCAEAILEKSMAGIIHQLRRERGLVSDTRVNSMRRIREITGS